MRNLKVFIAYNGADYHGFQRQDNAVSVQEIVEKALGRLLGTEPPVIYGCSRTDAGVHARRFCFNVHIDNAIPCKGFVKGLNTLLPSDIAVLSCEDVPDDFHARYCTRAKEYVYLINNKPTRDVFLQKLAYHYPYMLNFTAMNHAAELLVGEHDFAAFCKAEGRSRVKSTVRRIFTLNISQSDGICEIKICGNGFLYNMVRIISGTLIYVSEGRRNLDDIRRALETGDRSLAGVTLPPEGLYLNEVYYKDMNEPDARTLIRSAGKLHTTEGGIDRIRRNLMLKDADVVKWCRELILLPGASITRRGKNFYIRAGGCEITVNAFTYTIITAHFYN